MISLSKSSIQIVSNGSCLITCETTNHVYSRVWLQRIWQWCQDKRLVGLAGVGACGGDCVCSSQVPHPFPTPLPHSPGSLVKVLCVYVKVGVCGCHGERGSKRSAVKGWSRMLDSENVVWMGWRPLDMVAYCGTILCCRNKSALIQLKIIVYCECT